MSHATVMVITSHEPTKGFLSELLQPFHEYECTGVNDEYVVDVDITEDVRKEFDQHTYTRLRAPNGTLYDNHDDMFYREPTEAESKAIGPLAGSGGGGGIYHHSKDWGDGQGYRTKVHYQPEGYEKIEVPASSVKTFASFCEDYYGAKPAWESEGPDVYGLHKYGYTLINAQGDVVKVINRTNPNAKWDWWEVGGRWTGFFKMKPGYNTGIIGEPGLMTPPAKAGMADIARKSDIDFEAMMQEMEDSARDRYTRVHALIAGREVHSWAHVRDVLYPGNIDNARDVYHSQIVVTALRASNDDSLRYLNVDDYLCSLDEYVELQRSKAIVPFAILYEGQWYEHGRLGWWGSVHGDKDEDAWTAEAMKLLMSQPDESWLSIVDYHI